MIDCKLSTIVFDAGGVLLYIRRRRNEIAKRLLLSIGYEEEKIEEALRIGEAFDEEYFNKNPWIYNWKEERQWLTGHYNAIANAIDKDNEHLGDKLFMLTFDTNEYYLYPETIEVLEALKERYCLGVISNALPSLDWAFDSLGIRKYFKSVVISAYEGVEKPNKDIYIKGVERLGCKFQECIFIDDKLENVQAAMSLGMKGFYLDRQKDNLKGLFDLLDDM
jgi:HAD superfamily hydrolase (TIGR01509 family)